MWMKNVKTFKEQKFSFRMLLSIGLIFCHFQPGVAYKNVTNKKAYVFNIYGKSAKESW